MSARKLIEIVSTHTQAKYPRANQALSHPVNRPEGSFQGSFLPQRGDESAKFGGCPGRNGEGEPVQDGSENNIPSHIARRLERVLCTTGLYEHTILVRMYSSLLRSRSFGTAS